MITVGLDFGTHQTKVCVETKNGVELDYTFFKFLDTNGTLQYTLPSIIFVDESGYISYGYVPHNNNGRIIRYFKQSAFTTISNGIPKGNAIYFSTWYIASILFDLEEKYGQEFTIQMGVPSDSERLSARKELAVCILASAYNLVENVFKNNKRKFLKTTIKELVDITTILPYSDELKEEFGVLVFPEAYACLMPLISSSKISTGMSLIVDIGGGTTDISFFTIEKSKRTKENRPQVYDFQSIDKGLNFLTDAHNSPDKGLDSNVEDASEICLIRQEILENEVKTHCGNLVQRLYKEFTKQCNLPTSALNSALLSRPIIYTGGGSTFNVLRTECLEFKDIIHISDKEWRKKSVSELETIRSLDLCPILSTSYGLSISVIDDNIECKPFDDIFKHIRGIGSDKETSDVFSYTDDYSAMK